MLIINPGTEPVDGATEDNARTAVRLLVEDIAATGADTAWTDETMTDQGGGRWSTTITVGGRPHEIEMPGCDPACTREGRPWYSPRLYVDGSSWLWPYALDVLLSSDETDED